MRGQERLVFGAYVQDALSEGFAPNCDPDERTHTLSRLAIAAHAEGSPTRIADTNYIDYDYIPSWARGVLVRISCEEIAGHNMHLFDSMYLNRPFSAPRDSEIGGDYLTVADNSVATPNSIELSTVEYDGRVFELGLGDKLQVARLAIANAASRVFDFQPIK